MDLQTVVWIQLFVAITLSLDYLLYSISQLFQTLNDHEALILSNYTVPVVFLCAVVDFAVFVSVLLSGPALIVTEMTDH